MVMWGGGDVTVTTESFATPMQNIGADGTYVGTWQSSHKWKVVGIQECHPNGPSSSWWGVNIAKAQVDQNGLVRIQIHNQADKSNNCQGVGTIIGILDED